MLITLALRNLSRYRVRSVITIIAIMISVLVSVVVDGFIRGITNLSDYNLVNYESSEAVIYADGYFEDIEELPSDKIISSADKNLIEERLKKAGLNYAPRYKSASELVSYNEDGVELTLNSVLVAIDVEKDKSVYNLPPAIEKGTWLSDGDDGIVVGDAIANKLDLDIDSYLTITCNGRDGYQETLDVKVVGIFVSENTALNASTVFMSLSFLDDYLSLDGGVSEISISDGKLSINNNLYKDVTKAVGDINGIEILGWREVNKDYLSISAGDKTGSYLLLFFLFILAAAGIINTMMMAVIERRKECAMMLAMGFSKHEINMLFSLEGCVAGVIGSLIGVIVAAIVNYPLAKYGIDMSSLIPADVDLGYRVSLIFHSGWYLHSFVVIPLLAILLSTLSAYIPIRRSLRESIAEMLRRG